MKVMSNLKIDPTCKISHQGQNLTFDQVVKVYRANYDKINHKTHRKIVKKTRRRFSRQANAVISKKIREKCPIVQSRPLVETSEDQDQKEIDEKSKRDHELWLERERQAQIQWQAKKERELREELLSKLHEKRQQKSQLEESRRKQEEEARRLNNQARPAHNPVLTLEEIEQLYKQTCKFFLRTGVCRYGNSCNRIHHVQSSVNSMSTLIFPGMYTHMLLGYETLRKLDSDEILEYEESDILENYKEFYQDVLSEMKRYGRVAQFITCSNYAPHLRGNVYVQFEKEEEATRAYAHLNGRYYAGKQLYCFFTHVKDWHEAICRSFQRGKCDKGSSCNYLHVFENPRGTDETRSTKRRRSRSRKRAKNKSREKSPR